MFCPKEAFSIYMLPVYICIHIPGPLAAIFITSMAISVFAAPLSVLVSVTFLVSVLVFHASVSVIKI